MANRTSNRAARRLFGINYTVSNRRKWQAALPWALWDFRVRVKPSRKQKRARRKAGELAE